MAAERPPAEAPLFGASSVAEAYQHSLAPVLFEPWAEVLIEKAGVRPGAHVLDVASGTGVVARLASRYAGPQGRVIASDISAQMLAESASQPAVAGGAPIEFLEASATELPLADHCVDVVLCQQGLQFVGDRLAAAREMLRVLRPEGVACAAVWAPGFRLEPFDDYIEAAVAAGAKPPFPGAFDRARFVVSAGELRAAFEGAEFTTVEVATVDLEVEWADAASAAAGIGGTPYGPQVAALPAERRALLDAELARRFGAPPPIRRTTTVVLMRAVAPSAR